jgi:hypothetical protein
MGCRKSYSVSVTEKRHMSILGNLFGKKGEADTEESKSKQSQSTTTPTTETAETETETAATQSTDTQTVSSQTVVTESAVSGVESEESSVEDMSADDGMTSSEDSTVSSLSSERVVFESRDSLQSTLLEVAQATYGADASLSTSLNGDLVTKAQFLNNAIDATGCYFPNRELALIDTVAAAVDYVWETQQVLQTVEEVEYPSNVEFFDERVGRPTREQRARSVITKGYPIGPVKPRKVPLPPL